MVSFVSWLTAGRTGPAATPRSRASGAGLVVLLALSLVLLMSGLDGRGPRVVASGIVGLVVVRYLSRDTRVVPWNVGLAELMLGTAAATALTHHQELAGWAVIAGALAIVSPAAPPRQTRQRPRG